MMIALEEPWDTNNICMPITEIMGVFSVTWSSGNDRTVWVMGVDSGCCKRSTVHLASPALEQSLDAVYHDASVIDRRSEPFGLEISERFPGRPCSSGATSPQSSFRAFRGSGSTAMQYRCVSGYDLIDFLSRVLGSMMICIVSIEFIVDHGLGAVPLVPIPTYILGGYGVCLPTLSRGLFTIKTRFFTSSRWESGGSFNGSLRSTFATLFVRPAALASTE